MILLWGQGRSYLFAGSLDQESNQGIGGRQGEFFAHLYDAQGLEPAARSKVRVTLEHPEPQTHLLTEYHQAETRGQASQHNDHRDILDRVLCLLRVLKSNETAGHQ